MLDFILLKLVNNSQKLIKSKAWNYLVLHDPLRMIGIVVRRCGVEFINGKSYLSDRKADIHISLNTEITVTLWIEGQINELKYRYYQSRKRRGLKQSLP